MNFCCNSLLKYFLRSACSTQLRKAYQTASVLFEVLKAVDVDGTQVDSEVKLLNYLVWCFIVSLEHEVILIFIFSPWPWLLVFICANNVYTDFGGSSKGCRKDPHLCSLQHSSSWSWQRRSGNYDLSRGRSALNFLNFVSILLTFIWQWPVNLQIQAVLFALRCTKGLPWPKEHENEDIDILDWLQSVFGFQVDLDILSRIFFHLINLIRFVFCSTKQLIFFSISFLFDRKIMFPTKGSTSYCYLQIYTCANFQS